MSASLYRDSGADVQMKAALQTSAAGVWGSGFSRRSRKERRMGGVERRRKRRGEGRREGNGRGEVEGERGSV